MSSIGVVLVDNLTLGYQTCKILQNLSCKLKNIYNLSKIKVDYSIKHV